MTDRLVASYWTIAGAPVGEPARWPIEARVRAAAEAGFWGIGEHYDDYLRSRERGITDAELLRLLESHGMVVDEVEFLTGWSSDDDAIRAQSLRIEEQLYAAADAFGSRQLNVGCSELLGSLPGVERVAERFGALCRRAAMHGLVVAIEFLPWSGIPDVANAWQIVRLAGEDNGAVLLDTWHFFRGKPSLEDLRLVPVERISGIQLNDGPATPAGEIREETRHGRLLPGRGDFDLTAVLKQLGAMGAGAPWAVEVMSDELVSMDLASACQAAYDSTLSALAKAGF